MQHIVALGAVIGQLPGRIGAFFGVKPLPFNRVMKAALAAGIGCEIAKQAKTHGQCAIQMVPQPLPVMGQGKVVFHLNASRQARAAQGQNIDRANFARQPRSGCDIGAGLGRPMGIDAEDGAQEKIAVFCFAL